MRKPPTSCWAALTVGLFAVDNILPACPLLSPVPTIVQQSPPKHDAEVSPDYNAWGTETLDQIERDLRRSGSALYADYGTGDGKRGQEFGGFAFIWPSSYMLRTLAAAARVQPERYRQRMIEYADALDAYWIEKEGKGGFAVLPHGSER